MKTVFLSGSRKIKTLNEAIRDRLSGVVADNPAIIVGDADGADKAFQQYLSAIRYHNVRIFCSGRVCRNNLGQWEVKRVPVDHTLNARAFYTQKDKAMAARADYGFVLWDGKSPGSLHNIMELLKRNTDVLVYFSPEKAFYALSSLDDAQRLLKQCERPAFEDMSHTTRLRSAIREIENMAQGSLNLQQEPVAYSSVAHTPLQRSKHNVNRRS